MESTRILVVDDDREICELLDEYLSKSGYSVATVSDGRALSTYLQQHGYPDLVLLDVMLPGDDGFTLCQKIRRDSNVPIIMLTAVSDETDQIIGLEIGADDYIAKPFSPRELMARIKALLRRAEFRQPAKESGRCIRFADWSLDTLSQQLVNDDGSQMDLTGSDFILLSLFLQHPGQVLDRDTISDATRGRETLPMERGIDVQISRLRQKLGDNGKSPRIIKTIRGSGYMLIAEVSHED